MNTLSTVETTCATRPATAGSATVMCLMSMCVVMSFGTATLTMLLARQSVVKRAIEVDAAFMAAEASVDLAMSELRNNKDHAGDGIGVVSGSAGRASFTATLVPPFAGPRSYTIHAAGSVGSIARQIEVDVEPGTAGRRGFVGLDSVSMSGGVVDTYDSRVGSYTSQVSSSASRAGTVHLQSNGNISLSGSAMIHGDATPGPGKTVSGATSVTGSTAPAASPIAAEEYTYSPPIDTSGPVSSTITLGTGKHRYTSFVINSGKVATINGDVELWVDGKFEISGSGTAILEHGARLCIHHGTDKFTISGSGFVNRDQKPTSLIVYSATTFGVTCASSAEFFGSIEATKAPFTASGMGIYGSVAAKAMTLTGSTSLHYDKALGGGNGAYRRRLIWPSNGAARKS